MDYISQASLSLGFWLELAMEASAGDQWVGGGRGPGTYPLLPSFLSQSGPAVTMFL